MSPGVEPLFFLNDSFSEDGAQEYAVVRNGRQIESITFSWCSRAEAHNHIDYLARWAAGTTRAQWTCALNLLTATSAACAANPIIQREERDVPAKDS